MAAELIITPEAGQDIADASTWYENLRFGIGENLLSLDDLSEAEIEKLWLAEAIRRDEEIEAGKVALRQSEEVFRDARTQWSI